MPQTCLAMGSLRGARGLPEVPEGARQAWASKGGAVGRGFSLLSFGPFFGCLVVPLSRDYVSSRHSMGLFGVH